jgi:hypothetical protein
LGIYLYYIIKKTEYVLNCFFLLIKAMMCLLNFLRYRQGVSTIFSSGYEDQSLDGNHEYAAGGNDQYNNIGGNNGAPYDNEYNNTGGGGGGGYQQPSY